jgi:hypothetical protein
MSRRRLTLEDQATTVKDRGEGKVHESERILPEAESATGEPGISPPITPG